MRPKLRKNKILLLTVKIITIMNAESIIFYLIAFVILVFSVLTVTTKKIIRSAMFLFFTLLGTAGIYFLLGYTFLGAVQIMVYAGGIVVLFVFSILLTSANDEKLDRLKIGKLVAAAITCLIGAGIVLFIIITHDFANAITQLVPNENTASIASIGQHMLSFEKFGYVLPFEAVSILLLACIVGGLIIARKR